MSELKICRICLRTQCKVYNYDLFQLKAYYEEVLAQKVSDKESLPRYFCYECATTLHKFHKFKEKCYSGQKALKEISWRGPITYEAVYKIDRALRNLKSSLEIVTVSKRVRTYITTDNAEQTESDSESVQMEDEKEVNIKDIESRQVFLEEGSITDDHLDSDISMIDEDSKNFIQANKQEGVGDKVTEDIKDFDDIVDSYEDGPGSPKTVFVDIKKDVITLKSEPIKVRKRRSSPDFGLKKQNPKYAKRRTRRLNSETWKMYTLSEEDAVKEFQAKAKSKKYLDAAFKCTECYKGFSKEEMLKRHMHLRHSEARGSLECRFCRMRFKWDCLVRKHMRQHFTRYKCLLCDLRCTVETTALMHEEYHKGIIKKCVHCGEEFKHISTYYTHLRTHRSAFLCALCGMSFVSAMGLQMHKRIKHVHNEIESPDDDEEVNTFCEKCDIRFETRRAYEEHLFHSAMHTEGIEEESPQLAAPRKVLGKKLQAQITYSLKRRKTIPEGSAPLKAARKRRKVRKCHRKPTTCHQCGVHFSTQAACMKHHLAEHPRTSFHPPAERHICEICGASLAPGSVAMHENMHSKKKLFPCETCGRTFYSSVGIKRHILTHTGEKPFACTLCDKRFTQSNSMKLHYNTFHLKMPYPKRNRRKKKDDGPAGRADDSPGSSGDSAPPSPAPAPAHEDSDMHYLTLS